MLSSPEVRDGQFRFTFAAQPGKTYLIQAKNHLDDPVWVGVQEIPASQSTAEFSETLPGTDARYYRVITSDESTARLECRPGKAIGAPARVCTVRPQMLVRVRTAAHHET